ncbi:16S rRNA (adenine(1518)-N(6)/adenine(1519)-N(6))-dimethyltransferase RsmA [Burkholderia glumae]|uniref:Ribosomal RNA small subunit methyltransferase A n=1 Tax=Burkholderia glumae TaxID=337 RepID=A0AAQ0BUK0_BURGL|nr:16S rRNA (adenine(1518)-N(6)/adenine(1519)-N(6))-dimethyltransferase RsmA [Burkholderia glumae]ACR30122.1 Dimethyladenosine transferase [Burkholderia glumae BGR1]AJY65115.1 ribosomal RNA small subunit methyltransferase A [Burkholderia glumae LMG 2196 = ATCC 33617]KHJ60072.1 16S rRNA methyltransferase [Burkholderia glumae]MCM2482235.1 16S rRNA (adenine(1518)-N(6)/adenine(1519)-N(6))-dimethyltransferase RsmA [Burkholderia glumae]MCM2491168.1 16S rRNA (adenine(1518)-N(6)/adenine(1519)-N(6))-di
MSNSRQHQGHFARKRFGQNFLVDTGVIDSIVSTIRPERGQRMVEIGPGLGALTGPVIERLATPEAPLHAVELDRDLIGRLKQRFGSLLELHAGDALGFDFGALALPGEQPSLRIIGNLPYNISSPLLFHLMRFAERVVDQHFMLQNEVVERMVAEPGSKAFSRLSVMLQYRYVMDKLIDVPPESFQPPPKVDSAIVRMIPHAPHELAEVDVGVLGEVVTAAFSQRRKMLRNTLGAYRDVVDFEALGFDLARRAEDVGVAEYVRLARTVAATRPAAG